MSSPRTGPKQRRARLTSPDPIEIAMEMATDDGEAARRLLLKQGALIDADLHHRRWQIASERAGFVLKVLVGLAGAAAAVALGFMMWSASQDRSLIIDAVGAPEDMVRQGATGAALAHALQDKLAALQADTVSQYVPAELRGKDAGDLKVMIPQTGVSLVELNQALREWLGHQTHVTAEVSRPATGPDAGALVLASRVGSRPGRRVVQKDGDLDALLTSAAERLYADLDPLRHAQWLAQHGRVLEATAELRRLSASGPDLQRAQALALWALEPGLPIRTRRDREAQAVELSRGKIGANNLAYSENNLGHTEMAYQGFVKAEHNDRTRPDPALTVEARRGNRFNARENVAMAIGDFNTGLVYSCSTFDVTVCTGPELARRVQARPDIPAAGRLRWSAAIALAGLHEPSNAAVLIAAPRPETADEAQRANSDRVWLMAAIRLDVEREDWPALLRHADAFNAIVARYPDLQYYSSSSGISRALAQAHLGQWVEAEQSAAALPPDCYHCVIVRGRLAALKQDWRGADRWFADAVRQGPSLPLAETHWGRVLIEQGKPGEAIAKLSSAHRKSPKFADPLAYWGEALLAKGDGKAAAAKFEAAAKLAPRWGRLHLKWGEALAKSGKSETARAQYALAGRLDLTADERAELAQMQGRH